MTDVDPSDDLDAPRRRQADRGPRHVRRPDPQRQRGDAGHPRSPSARTRPSPTCGSRARSAGSRSRRPGHAYFALKDAKSQLQCVWFRDDRLRSAFEAQTGLRVVAHGRMDLYEPNGGLQLYVESIQPAGVGDLALRFEALKARLAAEGLFETARKRRLPTRPTTIAVITSPTGVVWKDICHVLGTSLAAGARRPRRGAGPGRQCPGQPRLGVPAARGPHDPAARGRPCRPGPDGHDHRAGWGIARGPLGVQRRTCRPRGRGAPGARSSRASATRRT